MLSRSQSMALWAPLDPSAFDSIAQQQQYMSLRKSLTKACAELLVRQQHQLDSSQKACQQHGCTDTSCIYARGAVVFTAQSLVAGAAANKEEGISTQWKSILELAAFHRPSLLRLALTYEPHEEVLFIIHIPSGIVGQLLRAEAVPGIGLVGYGTVLLSELSKGLVQLCFQEVCEQLPDGVTSIDASQLTVDPTSQDKLPAAPLIDGLQTWPHRCLAYLPWEGPQGLVVTSLQPAAGSTTLQAGNEGDNQELDGEQLDACQPAPEGIAEDEQKDCEGQSAGQTVPAGQLVDTQLHTLIDGIPPGNAAVGHGLPTNTIQAPVHDRLPAVDCTAGNTASSTACCTLQDGNVSRRTQRMYLQRTVNRFWLLLNGMAQRLTNRVRKIRCRDGICDGVSCKQCRGVMVFTVSALEGAQHAWHYMHNGGSVHSAAPKQYIRGTWHTPSSLILKLGSMDIQLLKCATTHDRRKGYMQTLHIPRVLLSGFLHDAPPGGLLFWRLVLFPDITPSLLTPLATVREDEHHHDTEAMLKTLQLQADVDISQGAGCTQGTTCVATGPLACMAPGCTLCEERFTGVRLLQCVACHSVAYCCVEHQKLHWKAHRKDCASASA